MMVTTSFAEIFAGDVPRIKDIVIFLDQAHRSGLSGSMSGTQVSSNHLVAFNDNREYLKNSVKKQSFDDLVDHFKIENPILITRRGGGFTIERGKIPEYFRVTFSLEYYPSFREADLPKDNAEVLDHVSNIEDLQTRLEGRGGGWNTYCMINKLWGHTKRLNKVLRSLELVSYDAS
jgi:hypothetical protein